MFQVLKKKSHMVYVLNSSYHAMSYIFSNIEVCNFRTLVCPLKSEVFLNKLINYSPLKLTRFSGMYLKSFPWKKVLYLPSAGNKYIIVITWFMYYYKHRSSGSTSKLYKSSLSLPLGRRKLHTGMLRLAT